MKAFAAYLQSGLLVLLLSCVWSGFGQQAVADAPDTRLLHTLYLPAEGWAYTDESGQLTGVTVEIMRAFVEWLDAERGTAAELLFETETDWLVFYERIRNGEGALFGLGNVTITDQRAEELAFSPPYLQNIAVLVSPAASPGNVQPEDIASAYADLRAMAFADTLHEQRLQALAQEFWPTMAMDRAGSNPEILEAVAAGTHFAYLDVYNVYRAQAQGMPVQRQPAFDDPGETFGIIMPLDNPWQNELAAFFQADGGLMHSDWYAELLAQHLGEEVAELLVPADRAE